MVRTEKKRSRQERLVREIGKNPFLKDDELAKRLKVSVATVRLDRTELGIGEYRERVRDVAKTKANGVNDCGEVLDFNMYHDGISVLNTLDAAVFDGGTVIKGQAMYGYAENLAMSVINARSALVRVANIKYLKEVHRGDRLVAKYEVMRIKNNEYVVWVRIKKDMTEMFRAKFNLSVMDERDS
ncbi:MAG: fatty acid biosynthesis transcriptional regulator [Eubacteriales bacterium]|nr:fatty acid biosynthesis transcriptional regulator [Eubacteriales bacterium]